MLFSEFLELIGRVADIKFKNTGEMEGISLAQKIENILEELFPAFGLTKNEVNFVQEENSESDDDYWNDNIKEKNYSYFDLSTKLLILTS